jgi:nicotinate-nucleotide pyrophosphorylase (carboxylating)
VHGVGISRPAFLDGRGLTAPGPIDVGAQVACALAEDIGSGDVTASLVPAGQNVRGRIITREDAVLCGTPWVEETFRRLNPAVRLSWHAQDGDWVQAGALLLEIEGDARAVLSAERTALNFLQTLSGTATAARRCVAAVAGSGCTILDTRKTLPGLRTAQKYAVRCGGAQNHRIGLFDMFLIKENHIAAAGSLAAAVGTARRHLPKLKVEVEVESLAEFEEALQAQPDIIMLDDFSAADLVTAVAQNRARARPVKLEASGGISLETVMRTARTGVDYISIGALTKHVRAIDLSLRLDFGSVAPASGDGGL